MKTLEKTAGTIGRTSLALLLAVFVCACPPTVSAFAEEENADETTTEAVEAQDPTMDAADEVADAVDEAVDGEDATQVEAVEPKTDEPEVSLQATDADDPEAVVEAQDPNAFTVTNGEELEAALNTVNGSTDNESYIIELAGDVNLSATQTIATGKNVTLEGNGHAVILDGPAQLAVNGTLTLDGALTIKEAVGHEGSLLIVTGGTLNMNSGVTLEGNSIANTAHGGGVYLSDGATFNMNGGVIENFQAGQGGGVYVDNSRPQAVSTFTMNGDATIRNNASTNAGGGVYVGTRSVFTMEGNASIVQNTANAAGGVINYGQSTLTTVYNNTTINGAADIFNYPNAMMKLSPTNPDWVLLRTGTHVTGWYIDNYSQTDEHGYQGDGQHRWDPALDDSVEYTPTDGFTREQLYLIAGAPLVTVTWENEDGTVLFTMDKVNVADVPAADEYNELSGHGDPTEPPTDGYNLKFTGWVETHPEETEVVYIAEYQAVPESPDQSTPAPNADMPSNNHPIADASTHRDESKGGDLVQTGDAAMDFALAAGILGTVALFVLGYARVRSSKEQ